MKKLPLLFVLVFCAAGITQRCFAQGQGLNNPGSVVEVAGGCLSCPGSDWLNTDSAILDDDHFATVTMKSFPFCFSSTCFMAKGLVADHFGFTVPADATITGILVEIKRKASAAGAVKDSSVLLVRDGVPVGGNYASADWWEVNNVYAVYGEPGELWDTTWTPQQIDSSAFGVYIQPANFANTDQTAFVDRIGIVVFYTLPNSIPLANRETAFSISPNPATNSVTISGENVIGSPPDDSRASIATVSDVTGRKMTTVKLETRNTKLETLNFASGVYFVTVANGSQSVTRKLVVSH